MLSIPLASKAFKTLVIEDESSQKIKILSLELPLFDDKLSFKELFSDLMPDLATKIIKIYDFTS